MKHINIFEDYINFKKPSYRMSWNNNRPNIDGIFLGKNNKWQVRVRNINHGNITTISQHINKEDAKKAYDDYYKNNIKPEKIEKPKMVKSEKIEKPKMVKSEKIEKPKMVKSEKIEKPKMVKSEKIEKPNPYTISKLNDALYNFLNKIVDILPQSGIEYYEAKISIRPQITHVKIVNNKIRKEIICIIPIFKNDNRNKKSKFGYNIFEQIFTIRFINNDKYNSYIKTIFEYIIKNIESETTYLEIKSQSRIFYDFIFNEDEYEIILDKIKKLKIDDNLIMKLINY
jgi:hypothetical protein